MLLFAVCCVLLIRTMGVATGLTTSAVGGISTVLSKLFRAVFDAMPGCDISCCFVMLGAEKACCNNLVGRRGPRLSKVHADGDPVNPERGFRQRERSVGGQHAPARGTRQAAGACRKNPDPQFKGRGMLPGCVGSSEGDEMVKGAYMAKSKIKTRTPAHNPRTTLGSEPS